MKEIKELEELVKIEKDIYKNNKWQEDIKKVLQKAKINAGMQDVINAYTNTKYYTNINNKDKNGIEITTLLFSDMWAKNVKEIVEYIQKLNINKILINDKSTQLHDILLEFMKLGYKVTGYTVYMIQEYYNDGKEEKTAFIIEKQ